MKIAARTTPIALLALALLAIPPAAASAEPARGRGADSAQALEPRAAAVQEALLRLPYYGVFDFLTFAYDKGTVTLGGYVYQVGLKAAAERAVKRVPGVDEVKNTIQELSLSTGDDNLRWQVFYAIYTNDFLSRYAPEWGTPWGRRAMLRFSGRFAGFPGTQPIGNFPIHIIVDRGRVRLLGVVDNEADKSVAGLAARGVPGSFSVDNELVVATS